MTWQEYKEALLDVKNMTMFAKWLGKGIAIGLGIGLFTVIVGYLFLIMLAEASEQHYRNVVEPQVKVIQMQNLTQKGHE